MIRSLRRASLSAAAALLLVLPSFSPAAVPAQSGDFDDGTLALLQSKVKYVFVIYQENRSFDTYFGTFPGADGIYSRSPQETLGFTEPIINTDGTTGAVQPFRIGPAQFAADTDDIDHSHPRIVAKMDVSGGMAKMDRFALIEEQKYSPTGNPTLQAKQMGELAMAHEDCDTVPFLWNYASRFVLFDHIFQLMTGPSTPGNLSIFSAQAGQTQWELHPGQAYVGNGSAGAGEPVVDDNNPFAGSPVDPLSFGAVPINPGDVAGDKAGGTALNQTYASLALTLEGKRLSTTVKSDVDPVGDLGDVEDDVAEIGKENKAPVPWAWFQEGYDREVTDQAGPLDANGSHASYVTHHNGPQYFGYVGRNPAMRAAHLHGLSDFFNAVDHRALPQEGGVFYVKGGFTNLFGLKPADPDKAVQANFLGDDDHPAYSDAEISEAMVAQAVNHIARSPYWKNSAIIITWDDSEGNYDHVAPPLRELGPDGSLISDGPRVPLIVISPYAKTGVVSHAVGDHASVVKFIDKVFGLTPLATLPDEEKAEKLGRSEFGQSGLGPHDGETANITSLLDAFDRDRLTGSRAPLPASYATISDQVVSTIPALGGHGCTALGIVPTDANRPNPVPSDFNPRPKTDPGL
jgi:phospholipase C